MTTTDRDTRLLHHRALGRISDEPPVLMLGSLGTTMAMWDTQSRMLAARRRVLLVDHRGHGASPCPPGPYSIDALGADVLAVVDHLGIDRVALCGLSLGGMVAMWIASHAPDRVERLALVCTAAVLGPPSMWHERAEAVRSRGMTAVADVVLARWFTPATHRRARSLVDRYRAMLTATPAEGYAASCEAIASMDLRRDLPRIAAPTLILAGGADDATPVHKAVEIADGIPRAAVEVVGGAAHLANVERPDRVNALLSRHLLLPAREAR